MYLVGCLSKHISINFHKGILIDDFHKLYDSKGNTRKNNRIIKIDFTKEFDVYLLNPYLKRAIQMNEEKISLPKIEMEIPELMNAFFEEYPLLKAKFEKLAPSHQREYIEAITEAKKKETKLRRLEKMQEKLHSK